ncbi:MAG TPA: inositol monophosphatase family protein [Cyclobacteriaceae bacterium]|nr:inositol monophosphatase family protein [Cyclobacteriaceae bacterium]
MINLSAVEKNVIDICLEVGSFIDYEGNRFDRSRIEQKEGFNNLVSYVDKESEKKLVAALSRIVPGSGFIGEEGTAIEGTNGYRWIIDPLDGTTNFTHGLPLFAISIGLALKDKMVLGIIYEVNKKEMFHTVEGQPAYCNGKEIHVSGVLTLQECLMATGFPYYEFEKMEAYLNIIRHFLKQSHGVRRLGSAATDLAYVAAGRFEGFFEYNLNPWDVAAGAFLVQQAGGMVTDFKGGDNFLFGGEIVAGCGVQPKMLEIIRKEWGS